MMTAPGLILFYGGLVRSKNVLSTMMHSLILMALISAVWMVYGYSMAFAPGNAFCGNPFTHLFLKGVGAAPDADYARDDSGADVHAVSNDVRHHHARRSSAARWRNASSSARMSMFMLLWVTLIYFPLCHMVWGKGGFFNWALGGKIPVLDFAGGTVVHISSGVSALVFALMIGKRDGFPHEPMVPHNVVLSLIGTGLVVGRLVWFQCRQRAECRLAGDERVCGHAFFGGGGGVELGGDGMEIERQTQRARRGGRHGRGPGDDHAGVRFREHSGGILHRPGRGRRLLYWRSRKSNPFSATTIRWMCSACMASAASRAC